MNKKRAVLIFICAVLTALCVAGFFAVWQMKSLFGYRVWQNFYSEKEMSHDVIFYGASMVYADVSPVTLWREQGIAAYDLSGSGQPLWDTYFCIKESLKTQWPKLLAVECSDLKYTEEYTENRTAESLFGMKPSLNKFRAVRASVKPGELVDHLLEFPIWHSRFSELGKDDFEFARDPSLGRNFKGYKAYFNVTPFESLNDVRDVAAMAPVTPRRDLFLRNIIRLSKEKGIPLLLFLSPTNHEYPEEKALFNFGEEIARSENVPFVDFSDYMRDMGLDPGNDFADDLHLCASGSEKFSRFLGEYLMANYDLKDRRGEAGYESWDECVREFDEKAGNDALSKETDMVAYSRLLGQGPYYSYVISMEGVNSKENPYIRETLENLGISADRYEDGGVWIVENGEGTESRILYSSVGFSEYEHHMDIGSLAVSVSGAASERRDITGNISPVIDRMIKITGQQEIQFTEHGINILVYDRKFDIIVDKAGFDTDTGYGVVR